MMAGGHASSGRAVPMLAVRRPKLEMAGARGVSSAPASLLTFEIGQYQQKPCSQRAAPSQVQMAYKMHLYFHFPQNEGSRLVEEEPT
jgi:hypothetical protein